jgi:hypothetical protein
MQRRIQEQRELLKKALEEQKKNAAIPTGPTQNTIDTAKLAVPKTMSCPP